MENKMVEKLLPKSDTAKHFLGISAIVLLVLILIAVLIQGTIRAADDTLFIPQDSTIVRVINDDIMIIEIEGRQFLFYRRGQHVSISPWKE
jgi:hypothetical protein